MAGNAATVTKEVILRHPADKNRAGPRLTCPGPEQHQGWAPSAPSCPLQGSSLVKQTAADFRAARRKQVAAGARDPLAKLGWRPQATRLCRTPSPCPSPAGADCQTCAHTHARNASEGTQVQASDT